jgi:ATP-binding cassette, subfamily G (WHITE), member 2, PDR
MLINDCQALFNGVSFWMIDLNIQGLSSIMFSCFLFAIVFTIIDQQIIPRFISGSALFEAREYQSRTYSWPVFVSANVIVECTWMSLVSVLAFVSWYYPVGLWKYGDQISSMGNRASLSFLLVWFALLFAATLSQALAAGIRDAQTAVNIAQLLFSLSLVFCG